MKWRTLSRLPVLAVPFLKHLSRFNRLAHISTNLALLCTCTTIKVYVMFRLTTATLVLFFLLASNVGVGQAHPQSALDPARNRDRAVNSYVALRRYFYQPDTHLYHDTYPQVAGNPYSYHWPFSQAVAATVDMAKIPEIGSQYHDSVRDRFVGLEHYWNTTTPPPGYDSYVRPPLGGAAISFMTTTSGPGWNWCACIRSRATERRCSALSKFLISWFRDGIAIRRIWFQAGCFGRNRQTYAPAAPCPTPLLPS